jgi:hypothetical protein
VVTTGSLRITTEDEVASDQKAVVLNSGGTAARLKATLSIKERRQRASAVKDTCQRLFTELCDVYEKEDHNNNKGEEVIALDISTRAEDGIGTYLSTETPSTDSCEEMGFTPSSISRDKRCREADDDNGQDCTKTPFACTNKEQKKFILKQINASLEKEKESQGSRSVLKKNIEIGSKIADMLELSIGENRQFNERLLQIQLQELQEAKEERESSLRLKELELEKERIAFERVKMELELIKQQRELQR